MSKTNGASLVGGTTGRVACIRNLYLHDCPAISCGEHRGSGTWTDTIRIGDWIIFCTEKDLHHLVDAIDGHLMRKHHTIDSHTQLGVVTGQDLDDCGASPIQNLFPGD